MRNIGNRSRQEPFPGAPGSRFDRGCQRKYPGGLSPWQWYGGLPLAHWYVYVSAWSHVTDTTNQCQL